MTKIFYSTIIFICCISVKAQIKTDTLDGKTDTLRIQPAVMMPTMSSRGSSSYTPQIIPSSPQSQIIEKYLNHQITEYNGLPQIEIPIYEIKVKGLTIPITMSYHAGGIKYEQYDGDVSAGWSINSGLYRVSRSVNNRPDECVDFYNETTLENIQSEKMKDRYLADVVLNNYTDNGVNVGARPYYHILDSEYDIFNYMAPSTNGHFLITNRSNRSNLLATVLDNHLDKVKLVSSGEYYNQGVYYNYINSIDIVDSQGILYYFGGVDNQGEPLVERPVYNNETLYSDTYTAWPLTQITSPFKDKIYFKYEKRGHSNRSYVNYTVYDATDKLSTFIEPATYYNTRFENLNSPYSYVLLVSEIIAEHEIIKFVRYDDDYNLGKLANCIKEIQVYTKYNNQQIKKVIFNYETDSHLLLNSLSIVYPNTAKVNQKYNFDYYRKTDGKKNMDQWGFYNFQYDYGYFHKEFGDLLFFPTSSDGYYIPSKIKSYTSMNGFANRTENGEMPYYLSLKQITYPTGGTTQYEYEPHEYYDSTKGRQIKGGGQRIKKITSDPKDGTQYIITEFKYGDGENGRGLPNIDFNWRTYCDNIYHFPIEPAHVTGDPQMPSIEPTQYYFYTERKFSEVPLGDASLSYFNISYPQVSVYSYDGANRTYNGKTISLYSNDQRYTTEYVSDNIAISQFHQLDNGSAPLNIVSFNFGSGPKIKERLSYNNSNRLIQKEIYNYRTGYNSRAYHGLKVRQKVFFYNKSRPLREDAEDDIAYRFINTYYSTQNISYKDATSLLDRKTNTIYDIDNTPLTVSTNYTYDTQNRLIKESQSNGRGIMDKKYVYPSTSAHTALINKNMLSTVIKNTTYNKGIETGGKEDIYTSDSILPSSTLGGYAGTWRTEVTYDAYDMRGNLLQYTGLNGIPVCYLWGYGYKYPVAEIKNRTYAQISDMLDQTLVNRVASSLMPAESDLNRIKSLLTNSSLSDAFVTVYTYKPLVGILTSTDSSGVTTYYDYDSFGRLKETYIYKDNIVSPANKQVIQEYNYNYQAQ